MIPLSFLSDLKESVMLEKGLSADSEEQQQRKTNWEMRQKDEAVNWNVCKHTWIIFSKSQQSCFQFMVLNPIMGKLRSWCFNLFLIEFFL